MNPGRPVVATLSIGPVALRVRSDSVSADSYDSAYRPFLVPLDPHGAEHTAIDVEVVTERPPLNNAPAFFESGGAWSMQPEHGGYRLNFHRLDSDTLHTVARSNFGTTQVTVHIDQDELGMGSDGGAVATVECPVKYPLDQLLLMNHLAIRGGVIVHGAGVVLDGRCVLLAGVSGAGKSTIARLFMAAGQQERLLSDDRLIITAGTGRDELSGIRGWGTPWPGDAGVAKNEAAPLAAVVFLVKADADDLRPLRPAPAAQKLARVASCPWYDEARLPAALGTCSTILERVPSYDLHFREGPEVVDLLSGFDWDEERPAP